MNWTIRRAGLALSVAVALLLGAACKRNHPPSIPDVTGQRACRPGDTARFSATSTDPDDDSLSYLFAWVDTNGTDWSADYPSGEAAIGSHAYPEPDTHVVKVRARDARGAVSDWSTGETLRVGVSSPGTPARPAGTSSGLTGDTYRCSTCAASPYDEPVTIEYDWGGSLGGWGPPVASGSLYVGTHVFVLPGTYQVRARAGDSTGLVSPWSDSLAVTVTSADTTAPVVSIVSPGNGDTVKAGDIVIKAVATDGEAVTKVEFYIDGTLAGTDSVGSPGDTFRYTWSDSAIQVAGQSYDLVAKAFDVAQHATSSATITITIAGDLGGVIWFWWNDDVNRNPASTSALVVNDGSEEVVMSSSRDGKFYSIRVSDGHTKAYASPKDNIDGQFIGHAASANGHVVVASDEYELYALSLGNLGRAWQYPDSAAGHSPPFEFGTAAINGADIYLSYDDTTIAHFQDIGTAVIPLLTYSLHASLVDAPVVDASGNVIFGTDSGYLIKIDGNLSSPIWRTHLMPVGDVNGPVIGSDGTIYCGCDDSRLFAVSPDSGTLIWAATLDGVGARPALGQSALFVGTEYGTAYSINPGTGAINWQRSLSPGFRFNTTPIVAANGYVYFQSEDDVLYCMNQADGTLIWACDCKEYLPGGRAGNSHRPRSLQSNEFPPNPSITSTGNIIVVGADALYCVAGYTTRPLDPAAAWPKWQKNLSNTGK